MRSAHRLKSTAHLVLGAATMGCSFWQLDLNPAAGAWFAPMLLGFLAIVLEIPEIVRNEDEAFDTAEIAELRRVFEAHCRHGGWSDVDLTMTRKGRYFLPSLNDGWNRWLARAEADRQALNTRGPASSR